MFWPFVIVRKLQTINFPQASSYITWFGTHKEYDKIDVQTIAFDTAILTNKKVN